MASNPKVRGVWVRVGQVLCTENATPRVAAKFYKALVQSMLLYSSKTWNLTRAMLAQLEGFHVCAAYKMAWKYKPHKGMFGKWKYPSTKDMLEECGLHSVEEYIQTCYENSNVYGRLRYTLNAGWGDVKEAQCRASGGEKKLGLDV